MKKRTLAILLSLGAAGLALYLYLRRYRLLARVLRLPVGAYDVSIQWKLRLSMPDGVALIADHYAPKDLENCPTILIRSPYGRGPEAGMFGRIFGLLAWSFASHGYHVLIQNTRGRYDSGGTFEPLLHEGADGLATIEWIAGQSWFNGVLGAWGPSYLGYCAWAVATAAPPQLKAIVPCIAFSRGHSVAWMDGVYSLDLALRALFLFDTTGNWARWSNDEARRRWDQMEEILEPAFRHLPLVEADQIGIGEPNPFYRESFAHPDPEDPYWASMDLHASLAQIQAPTLLVSGWYDLFLRDLLKDYAKLQATGRSPYLTIGPWYHTDFGFGGEFVRESLDWFHRHLKGEQSRMRDKPVRLYVMGAEEWREYDSWPPPAREERYFLHGWGRLSSQRPPVESAPGHYTYDPADPTPNLAGPLLLRPSGPVDNRNLEARDDVLTYTTPALDQPVEVIGPVRSVLYVRSSREHTDFFARLCDVHPDGRSINICDGLFRIAPGKGALQSDGTTCIEVDMWATAHVFLSGHRIRLQVSSGAFPRWNRNLGTGEPEGTATTMAASKQTIYHDAEHPSVLILPCV
jgi:putative CocE/NonD family hydrolase